MTGYVVEQIGQAADELKGVLTAAKRCGFRRDRLAESRRLRAAMSALDREAMAFMGNPSGFTEERALELLAEYKRVAALSLDALEMSQRKKA